MPRGRRARDTGADRNADGDVVCPQPTAADLAFIRQEFGELFGFGSGEALSTEPPTPRRNVDV